MPDKPIDGREPNFSEEDLQREKLGPRSVPGKESPTKRTPHRAGLLLPHCGLLGAV